VLCSPVAFMVCVCHPWGAKGQPVSLPTCLLPTHISLACKRICSRHACATDGPYVCAQFSPPPAALVCRRRVAVVTSEFHMPRTSATFDVVYALGGRTLYGDANWFQLDYRAGKLGGRGLGGGDAEASRVKGRNGGASRVGLQAGRVGWYGVG